MKKNAELELKDMGLFKVIANLDTQSAVVAAVVISLMTALATGFISLCNYVYWSAYFNKFNIPLAYIDEAIIPENGTKYLAVLYIPLLLLVWWLLAVLKKGVVAAWGKIKAKERKPLPPMLKGLGKGLGILYLVLFFLCAVYGFLSLLSWRGSYKLAVLLLYAEGVIFVLWSVCKAGLQKKFAFSGKAYYGIRIVALLVAVYLMLGHVYFAGSNSNYADAGLQSLQMVYDSNVNYYELEPNEELDSQLVLFETADYYYVADVKVVGGNYPTVRLWGNDTYRFISKVDCSVKNLHAYFAYIGSNQQSFSDGVHIALVLLSVAAVFTAVPLLSIPVRKKEEPAPTE